MESGCRDVHLGGHLGGHWPQQTRGNIFENTLPHLTIQRQSLDMVHSIPLKWPSSPTRIFHYPHTLYVLFLLVSAPLVAPLTHVLLYPVIPPTPSQAAFLSYQNPLLSTHLLLCPILACSSPSSSSSLTCTLPCPFFLLKWPLSSPTRTLYYPHTYSYAVLPSPKKRSSSPIRTLHFIQVLSIPLTNCRQPCLLLFSLHFDWPSGSQS